jgi:hypothetical protein
MELPKLIRKYPFEVNSKIGCKTYLLYLTSSLRAEIRLGPISSSKPAKIIELEGYHSIELIISKDSQILKHLSCTSEEADKLINLAVNEWRNK